MELLTGDTNILSIALVLQYVIGNPADFLFRVEAPQALVGTLAQTVLTETVGRHAGRRSADHRPRWPCRSG